MFDEKNFNTDETAAAAGVAAGTLRQWRARNNLLAETVDGTNTHKKFSALDVCVIRTVHLLSRFMAVEFAILFAEGKVRRKIKALLDRRDIQPDIGLELHDIWNGQPTFSDDPGSTRDELLDGSKGEIVLIDVQKRIIDPVLKKLKLNGPQ